MPALVGTIGVEVGPSASAGMTEGATEWAEESRLARVWALGGPAAQGDKEIGRFGDWEGD